MSTWSSVKLVIIMIDALRADRLPLREEIEEAGRLARVNYSLDLVIDERGEVIFAS